MTTLELEKLRFPIGAFQKPHNIDAATIQHWIQVIQQFPQQVKTLVQSLSTVQINWRYRPNGWTIKQVVHHCSDSHINSWIRFKLALTEDSPTIRPYLEERWAELSDSLDNDLSDTLLLLEGLHNKWAKLLSGLSTTDLEREFVHPEHGRRFSLKETIGIYAWHCQHHLAHIELALKVKGKFN